MNALNLPKKIVTIKIEDEEEKKEERKMITEKNNINSCIEKSTQTDSSDLLMAINFIVKKRLKQYQQACIHDEIIDKKIDPSLGRFQEENDQLKKELNSLRAKLAQIERKSLKRTREGRLSPVQIKKQAVETLSTSNNSSSDTSGSSYLAHSTTQRNKPPQPELLPQKPLVQLVTPAQQIRDVPHINSQHQPSEQRVIIVDENNHVIRNSTQGLNTQVVAANQGLRMTSVTPHLQNGQVNIIKNGQNANRLNPYQQVVNIPRVENNVAMQQQPIQQTIRHVPQHIYRPISRSTPSEIITLPYLTLPKLKASISASGNGIILTWDYEISGTAQANYRKVECYNLFANQAKDSGATPSADIKQWKKIGVVNALPLPMACTLTQFATGNVYFFAVLAVDINGREGEMSNPCIIRLNLT